MNFIKNSILLSAFLLLMAQEVSSAEAKRSNDDESISKSSFGEVKVSKRKIDISIPVDSIPFDPTRTQLYSRNELYGEAFGVMDKTPLPYEQTKDSDIYTNFVKNYPTPVELALSQRLHDHAITTALDLYLSKFDERKIVGIMGGHSVAKRDTEHFTNTAKLAYRLANEGYIIITGGGPGAMEAAHLGTWFRGRPLSDLEAAIAILREVPEFEDNPESKTRWLSKAHEVIAKYPRLLKDDAYPDVGIPTWFYGHEPSAPFASYIAKYFQNSVREEGILTLARGGIVYAPGSAGTIQEIFQDAGQNYYAKSSNPRNKFASPMIFFGQNYWQNTRVNVPANYRTVGTDVYKTLKDLARPYEKLVQITDDIDKVVEYLKDFYK
ncbi:MAG: hypothetical protein K2Y18_01135 [Alphaproteobacteria bacterium]|jgi:predicted Rossmann-fold nucleotide-binding protein|nr:hypothetical protein [Alphaproteobacteria bacterium]